MLENLAPWQVERAGRPEGALMRQQSEWLREDTETSPLAQMNYERDRLVVTTSKFLLAEGTLQNQDNEIQVKAARLTSLTDGALQLASHDFH